MAETTELVSVNELAKIRTGMRSAISVLRRKCEESVSCSSGLEVVPTEDEGFFWNSKHEVTGTELNTLITQIQSALSENGEQRRQLWVQLGDVYKTIDSLDADYLSKIEKSFDQINANYGRIKENNQQIRRDQKELESHRDRIDKLIQGHETALRVLKQFKARIDQLSHLEEVDKLLGKIDVEKSFKLIEEKLQKAHTVSKKHDVSIETIKTDVKVLMKRCEGFDETLQSHCSTIEDLKQFKLGVAALLSHVDIEKSLALLNDKVSAMTESSAEQLHKMEIVNASVKKLERRVQRVAIGVSVAILLSLCAVLLFVLC